MSTIKVIGLGVVLGTAVSIIAVLVLNSRQASTSPMPSTPVPSASETTEEGSPAMEKLAEAGIDVDTLAVLQECRKGWQDHAPKVQNALASQTAPNPK